MSFKKFKLLREANNNPRFVFAKFVVVMILLFVAGILQCASYDTLSK